MSPQWQRGKSRVTVPRYQFKFFAKREIALHCSYVGETLVRNELAYLSPQHPERLHPTIIASKLSFLSYQIS